MELDELWSFLKRRKNKRWIWLALCRRTRQVVAFAIGNRGKKTCLVLWKAIPDANKKAHCFADIWEEEQFALSAFFRLWLIAIHEHADFPAPDLG